MKKAILISSLVFWFLFVHTTFASSISFNCWGNNCFRAGVDAVGWLLWKNVWVVTGKGIAQAVQDLIVYLLGFLTLIAVIYIMYAGAQLLLNPANEESAAKTKKIIIWVVSGIVIIWFAWWIVSTVFYLLNNKKVTASLPIAVAETQVKMVDFTTYSNKIRALETRISWEYSPEVMNELSLLIDGAYQHLPDRGDMYQNKQNYDAVKKAISTYNLKREMIDRGIVENTVRTFLEQPKTFAIEANLDATPRTWDAPLSVTLEAKEAIDGSGTVIPNENFIWWMRTAEGAKILGKGKIVNYTFEMEGTYSVYLTINSASKNSQGFMDVISFEKSIVIEVGQPKIRFVIKMNDQLADQIVKIPTKEALKNISIDASETVFSSWYTVKKTEWDFGNGVTDTNEGGPQFESQKYEPGEHMIKLTLTRNDNEIFSKNIVLKIGDPLAAISINNKTPSKWERVIFQAQKVSKETDVQYLWEVKKEGIDTILNTVSGTRMEYVFGDTGRYFVSLTSVKWDARDKDTMEIIIESRPPSVEFTSSMVSTETPNMYLFDGTNSFDPDYPDNQKLRFEWFVNDTPMQLLETNALNNRGKYIFPEKGTYRVTLRVTDEDGKTQETKKDLKITSILFLKLTMRPEVVQRRAMTMLLVTAPPQVTVYEWRVGSEAPVITKNNRLATSFPISGTFPITVKVTNEEGDSNSITDKIYVTDEDKPFSVINIQRNSSSAASAQPSLCDNQEALTVDRANAVSFSADKSVNTNGKTEELTYFWQIGFNKVSTSKSVSYTFDELGCEEISLTVADKKTWVSHTSKAWVKVVNLAPQFSDIDVAIENIDMDPMRVNLKMTGAKDPDGVIRSYTWYYYTDRDDQAQWFRITRIPETTFVLPKITGRYYFDVMMEDSNGLKVNTKEVSESRFSTPELYINTNLATPIIENFVADTTEVKFWDTTRLSLGVRTALDSDISDKAEYRWDIDGDGFYDIKTTTPFYEFQYKYPWEYNPKVKVTHKGVSTTKSLTIIVKNRLIPKATLQMIGNKIVAYNISSGVFQKVNWYLDDKKISENRDYLVFDVETSTAKKLKLEISDGSTTESVIYPLERNLKNQILLKKITGPLIILSPISGGDVIETPDDIVWDDPMIPLFIYLGESRGSTIKYYVIDTDIDIDTDLNGQKNDDADNKWTASYRNGRPFQIPQGTKRVTIMRIRLVGENGEDLASRQIRVTRSFLALPDEVTTTKDPKTFNLSQEDKDRIEKLRNLVQWVPESERVEFNKLLDQLGDIWYDTADRTQTLILFSLAVDASSTLVPELKKKILEQINLIYTQGDDKSNERQSARKVIADALAKSSKKIEIFWDGTTVGLIDQMLDNPEYYEANLAIKQKIYDDYVEPDKTLSAEVKKVIEEKLMILVWAPLGTSDIPPVVITKSQSGLSLMLWILWGILFAILWFIGISYARQKLGTAWNDDIGGEHSHDDHLIQDTPLGPSENSFEHSDASATPDWLKEGGSPFWDEDVFSEKSSPSPEDVHQPDWIHDDVAIPEIVSNVPVASSENTVDASAESGMTTEKWRTPVLDAEDASTRNNILTSSETSDTSDWWNPPSSQKDIPITSPDDITPSSDISPQEDEQHISSVPVEENKTWITPSTPVSDIVENESGDWSSKEETVSQSLADDADIPDWLRGAEATIPDEVLASDESLFSPEMMGENISSSEPKISDTPIAEEILPKILQDETSALPPETDLLGAWGHLIEPEQNKTSNTKKETKKKQKKTPATKKRLISGENLLDPAHDMLLPPSDTNPTA